MVFQEFGWFAITMVSWIAFLSSILSLSINFSMASWLVGFLPIHLGFNFPVSGPDPVVCVSGRIFMITKQPCRLLWWAYLQLFQRLKSFSHTLSADLRRIRRWSFCQIWFRNDSAVSLLVDPFVIDFLLWLATDRILFLCEIYRRSVITSPCCWFQFASSRTNSPLRSVSSLIPSDHVWIPFFAILD